MDLDIENTYEALYGWVERAPRTCPVCHRLVTVNPVTGLLRQHHVKPGGEYCEGSGKPP